MPLYYIYSLDWPKFQRVVAATSGPQLLTLAEVISDGLDEFDSDFEDGDPLQQWPSDPEELCDIVRQRLQRDDWYGDLSYAGKRLWEWAFTTFCDDAGRKHVGFRVECDPVGGNVLDPACEHHGIPDDRMTDAIVSQFGERPYRYHPPARISRALGEWNPIHSMHAPEEVQGLLDELRSAQPAYRSAADEQVRVEFEDQLIPVIEKVARAKRLLYVQLDF